jgi:hypothetical protein
MDNEFLNNREIDNKLIEEVKERNRKEMILGRKKR